MFAGNTLSLNARKPMHAIDNYSLNNADICTHYHVCSLISMIQRPGVDRATYSITLPSIFSRYRDLLVPRHFFSRKNRSPFEAWNSKFLSRWRDCYSWTNRPAKREREKKGSSIGSVTRCTRCTRCSRYTGINLCTVSWGCLEVSTVHVLSRNVSQK